MLFPHCWGVITVPYHSRGVLHKVIYTPTNIIFIDTHFFPTPTISETSNPIVGVLLSFILDLDVVGGGGCCEVPGCGGEGCGGDGGVGCSRGGVGGGEDDATPSLLSLALLALDF